MVISGARLLHAILPEKFEMWKLENAVLGMFHKVLQCHGRTFGIDKTRQDNALFGVLYSPRYIDFIQII